MSKNIAIIGAGGINSWYIQHLAEILKIFDKKEITFVKIFDNDEVEEKNLVRGNQNFTINDLMEKKAQVLALKYNFDYQDSFIDENNLTLLDGFDIIILGVDNNKTRRLLYQYCLEKKKWLLDLRAQGTQMRFIVLNLEKNMEYYDKLLFSNKEVMERKGSCQLESDIRDDHIENANKAIAFIGAYCITLKYLRGEKIQLEDFHIAY